MNKVYKFISFSLIVLAAFIYSNGVVSAHVLKVDGNIGATLHVDPEDNPVSGQPASFYFEIKDRQNKFAPQQCDCQVDIKDKDGGVVKTEKLFTTSSSAGLTTPLLQHSFTKGGVYKVVLTGSPKAGIDFQKFALTFDVRVENASGTTTAETHDSATHDHTAHGVFLIGLVLGAGILVWLLVRRQKRRDASKASVSAIIAFAILASSFSLYTTRISLAFEPQPVHHHVADETGHAENHQSVLDVATAADVPVVAFSSSVQLIQRIELQIPLPVYTHITCVTESRAPPRA